MASFPRISVVIPCYNAEKLILGTLDSVASQSWPNLQIVVVDDGSTDKSTEFIAQHPSKPTIIRQRNAGVAAARNAGIRAADGDLVAFLDADDYWLSGKLAAQYDVLSANPDARLCYTAWAEWPSEDPVPNPQFLASLERRAARPGAFSGPSGWIYAQLLLECKVWTSTVLVARVLLEELGGFDQNLTIGEDYDLWLRASQTTRILRVNKPLALYRKHPSSLTQKALPENFQALVVGRALKKWGYRSPDGTQVDRGTVARALAVTWRDFANAHMSAGTWRLARRGSRSALRLEPFRPINWKIFVKSMLRMRAA